MPDTAFEVRTSGEAGLSRLRQRRYHTVIGDTELIEANDYALLKVASGLLSYTCAGFRKRLAISEGSAGAERRRAGCYFLPAQPAGLVRHPVGTMALPVTGNAV